MRKARTPGKCAACHHIDHEGYCGKKSRHSRCQCYVPTPAIAGALGLPQYTMPGVEPPPGSQVMMGESDA